MMPDNDFKLLRGFVTDGQTDRRTNERTFVNVESLSRLKSPYGGTLSQLGGEGVKITFEMSLLKIPFY